MPLTCGITFELTPRMFKELEKQVGPFICGQCAPPGLRKPPYYSLVTSGEPGWRYKEPLCDVEVLEKGDEKL